MGRNRSLDGVENKVTTEMGEYFRGEFAGMWHEHIVNRPGEYCGSG
jgi:hypothetical protein